MNAFPLALAALLLPSAVHAAVTVDEFATGRIYSSVNSDGVSVFTDIEPPELRASVGSSSSAVQVISPRAKVVAVKAAAVQYVENPVIADQESFPPSDQAPEGLPPRED